MITRQDFNNFVDKGFNIIPIAKKIYKDNETPLSIGPYIVSFKKGISPNS